MFFISLGTTVISKRIKKTKVMRSFFFGGGGEGLRGGKPGVLWEMYKWRIKEKS